MTQFNFDIMDSAGYGYYRVWTERRYLMKLALIPFLIKLACTVTILVLGYDNDILRQGLIMLPGDLALGWVLAQFCRTLLRDERWPTVIPHDVDEQMIDKLLLRARGIVSATIVYSLIALFGYLLRYVVFDKMLGGIPMPEAGDTEGMRAADIEKDVEISSAYMVPLLAMAFALFWGFRLMWLHIPFSVLMPISDYLKALGGMMASAKMIILFLCTMAPIMFLTVMATRVVFSTVGNTDGANDSLTQFLVIFLAVFSEVLVALVTTSSFIWAMRNLLPKNADLLKELPKLGE